MNYFRKTTVNCENFICIKCRWEMRDISWWTDWQKFVTIWSLVEFAFGFACLNFEHHINTHLHSFSSFDLMKIKNLNKFYIIFNPWMKSNIFKTWPKVHSESIEHIFKVKPLFIFEKIFLDNWYSFQNL